MVFSSVSTALPLGQADGFEFSSALPLGKADDLELSPALPLGQADGLELSPALPLGQADGLELSPGSSLHDTEMVQLKCRGSSLSRHWLSSLVFTSGIPAKNVQSMYRETTFSQHELHNPTRTLCPPPPVLGSRPGERCLQAGFPRAQAVTTG